uniref:Protein tincar n=1 Tax=Haemonchus contortus TaxID=6289 RepID=A0A7I4Z6J0_HAECO
MGCTLRARLNQICSIWYTTLVLCIQSYLLYLGFERYKLYTEMKWPTGGYPHVWLTIYITLYAACVPLSVLFFSFGFFKSGNIAGDNERLAEREDRVIEVSRNRKGEKSGCLHGMKSCWQHSPPMPQQIHVITALCQLVAQQFMISQLYRHGFVNSGDFLNTELDFLYQRARQLATNLPMGETRLTGFQITAEELRGSPLAPNLLPLLMNFRLFGVPLEFVNLLVALIAYACTYPAVFWRVSKPFSLIFSFHMVVYCVAVIWGYLGFSILFRIQETNYNSLRPLGLGQYLVQSRNWPFYHPHAIVGTFVASLMLMLMAPIALYSYGYNKYFVNVMNFQAKNHIRAGSSAGQSEYSDYKRRNYARPPSSELCCDGYAPHTIAIVLLVLIVIVRAPTIYALMILYQHEEKPLLLTCIIMDVVYLFTWILLWLMLTLKREWSFNVAHKVHQMYALQKGLATGHIKGNENPSQLKNSVIVMQRDHMFITDDQAAKQSLLRHLQRGHFDAPEEMYWSKSNGNQNSCTTRKLPLNDSAINTPETSRLIQRPVEDTVAYNSVVRHSHGPLSHSAQISIRANGSPPDSRGQNTFGTLQRRENTTYTSNLQRNPTSVQRSIAAGQWPSQQEAYASIHKAKEQALYQRRDSADNSHYGKIENNYSNYGTYSRLPPQSRIPIPPGQHLSAVAMNNSGYSQQKTNTPSVISAVRQSPMLSERSYGGHQGASSNIMTTSSRDQSPYHRSAIKLTSFDTSDKGGVYGSVPSQWTSQRAPPGQPGQPSYNSNKPTMSASSSQQEQCFTPTSTLTSQGSTSNYDGQTPTPGSPQINTPLYGQNTSNGGGGLYGTIVEDNTYTDRTLQKPSRAVSTGSTSVRHAMKAVGQRNDDSANFSLTSSNGSSEVNKSSNDFATSIV